MVRLRDAPYFRVKTPDRDVRDGVTGRIIKSCRPFSETDLVVSSSIRVTEMNRRTSMSNVTIAKRNSGSSPFGLSGVEGFPAKRST